VRAAVEKLLVHGQEYRCVLKYSASFAGVAVAQFDYQPQQSPASLAAARHGTEQTAGPLEGKPDPQQDPALVIGNSFRRN
jgi:hypothetical protein